MLTQNKLADSTKAFVLNDREQFTKKSAGATGDRDEALIREERTKTISALSDESIGRYFALTGELMTVRYKKKK